MSNASRATVEGVSRSPKHTFSKPSQAYIRLLAWLGVEGDAHLGVTVKHRSRVARDPSQPNLRQVHLIAVELLEELAKQGFEIKPGQLGENIATRGLDLLTLPTGTILYIGSDAIVEVTGLRNPCAQIDNFKNGLLKAVLGHDSAGNLVRKAGIMGVVRAGGIIRPGEKIQVELPPEPHKVLEVV